MNFMKNFMRVVGIFLVAIVTEVANGEELNNGGKINIVTSFYPIYITVLNIAGNIPDVNVANLTKPFTGCLHDYQLTPDDMKTLSHADIFVINGAGMEAFIEKIIKEKPNLKIVNASEGISLIKGTEEEGDNPHVWVSVSCVIKQTKNIAEGLSKYDSLNAAKYMENASLYISKLESLKTKMHNALDNMKNRKIITFHEAFPYFAREFNFEIAAVVEREPGSEPSAREMVDTINVVRASGIKVLFAEPQYPAKSMDIIAKETGAKVYILDSAVTGLMERDAYIKIMEKNLEVMKEALK